ncbi:hypothetical protein [Nonomuraea typhae]|uniref:Uncharacterized protein n=1 Tax=Nonomuraea typhae TaxID=2603600 RepID=A0ABW7YXU8_9ACTN
MTSWSFAGGIVLLTLMGALANAQPLLDRLFLLLVAAAIVLTLVARFERVARQVEDTGPIEAAHGLGFKQGWRAALLKRDGSVSRK